MFKNLFRKTHTQNLYAPVNGEIVQLEQVNDPVFSQKIMGEGIAIIPVDGEIVAPVDGEVTMIASTNHAIGIRTKKGTEILIHIGLETVALKGKGFEVLVKEGEQVSTGQPLITFDLPYIRDHAKDIITPIIITNGNDDKNQQITLTSEKKALAGKTLLVTLSST